MIHLFYIKPVILAQSPEVSLEFNDTQKTSLGELIISNGENLVKTNLITGSFTNDKEEIIDIINKVDYKIIKYTTQIIDNNRILSSELKIIIDDDGNNPTLMEYGFGENNFINYRLEIGDSDIYLIASDINAGSFFKLHKTSM